tara:strand:- start:2009 stop:2938 length:930 start_codon:yes stop_codon:yes gene_type:complete
VTETPEFELAIIGGGFTGLTAGLIAARAGLNVKLFDRMGPGGQLINIDRVDNYPGLPTGIAGYELGPAALEQALDAGVKIDYGEIDGLTFDGEHWQLITNTGVVTAYAVIVATGSELAKLGLDGEEELHGSGISYCATCDAEFFRDQDIMVVGGGDSGLDEVLVLAPVVRSITLVTRGELDGAATTVNAVRALENVTIHCNTTLTELHGTAQLEGVSVIHRENGETAHLKVSGLFIYVGLNANTSLLEGLIPLDTAGHAQVDIMMATEQPGLFVAGDLRAGSVRLLASCAGDGATAAVAAERYIRSTLG